MTDTIRLESLLSASNSVQAELPFHMTYLYGGSIAQQINLVKTVGSFQTVTPAYFDIDANGKLALGPISTELIRAMHSMNIKVVPMLSNHWDRRAGQLALRDPEGLARQIADYVEQYQLDGVNVDIEMLPKQKRRLYAPCSCASAKNPQRKGGICSCGR